MSDAGVPNGRWLPVASRETCDALPTIGARRRVDIRAAPGSVAMHGRLLQELQIFDRVECRPLLTTRPIEAPATVAFLNVERCKFVAPTAALLRAVGADIALLTEVDNGMARSGNHHTTAALADMLGMGYGFAVEFLELGLGDARERARHGGAENELGLHGNGLLAASEIASTAVLRLDQNGRWFGADADQRRIGGRMAIAGVVIVAGCEICAVSVHLESHSGPTDRAQQMRTLVAAVDAVAAGRPVVIGGDFNTSTRDGSRRGGGGTAALSDDERRRLADPVRHEPLFDVAAAGGYDWIACNAAGTTTRTPPDRPPSPAMKLDWFFTRGVVAGNPRIVPAVDEQGQAISDHELLTIEVAPA